MRRSLRHQLTTVVTVAAASAAVLVGSVTPATAEVAPCGGSCAQFVPTICGLSCIQYSGAFGTLTVLNDANCDLVSVELDLDIAASTYGVDAGWDDDANCHVVPTAQTSLPAGTGDLAGTISEATDLELPGSICLSCITTSPESPDSYTANFIHTSQTLQDGPNIDIAKMKSVMERYYDGNGTWVVNEGSYYYWTQISTSRSWNHPTEIVYTGFDWGCTENSPCTEATGSVTGKFHTDWIWCNSKSNWQKIELLTTTYSEKNGKYHAKYRQHVACPGTHHATRTRANNSSTL